MTDIEEKIELTDKVRSRYENAQYGIAGRHSGVQICSWTKKALRGKGVCYKQKFYGIDCHRCCQMSPSVAWCQQSCIFCWRSVEWMGKTKMEEKEVDDPEKIIADCVKQRKKLLGGIGGAYDVNRKAFDLSFKGFPSHWAISLSGEPTIYPKLGELVKDLRDRREVRSIFIVSNGQEPGIINQMAKDGALPTQLYISLAAPNKELHQKINRSTYSNGWQRLNKTLELLPNLSCRKVIRLTLIKGVNDAQEHIPKYAELLEKSESDFIEIKSYMHLGLSRERLARENMPSHEEIKQFGARLLEMLPDYRYENEDDKSRIVLLKKIDSEVENVIKRE